MNQMTRRDFQCDAATNASAYRTVTVPVLEIQAPLAGPAVALIAGVHGDEWEGQIALQWLWQQLPAMLRRGTVLLVPVANISASRAGTRLAPDDGGNLNRAFFPDIPARDYTETLAQAIDTQILSRVTHMVDIHSGGASLRYPAATVVTRYRDDPLDERVMAMARAFGSPYCLFFRSAMPGSMPAAASRRGIARLSTEVGGGRETSHEMSTVCRDGLLRCLAHLGMVETDLTPAQERSEPPSLFDVSPSGMTLRATADGVFVPSVSLDERVTVGQALGQYSEPTEPDRPIMSILAPHDGVIICHRAIARSQAGDCLFQIAPERAFSSLPELFSLCK